MKISVTRPPAKTRLATAAVRKLTAWIAERAGLTPANGWSGLHLVLADDERICSANSAVFGRPAVTDVISCAYAPAPGRAGRCAEIVVNCDRARSSRFPGRELALYIAHGCDHLAGATDDTPARRKRMLRREQGWLRAATRAGITLRLFAAE